ncbi:hypothetical protein Droror1_Dr00011341 [Drosera rotundifolia]
MICPNSHLPWRLYYHTLKLFFTTISVIVVQVLAIGVDCDLALLSVDNEEFWDDVVPVVFGKLPQLQASVTVVGYPTGGDTIHVTKGVVSRIEIFIKPSFQKIIYFKGSSS